QLGEGHLGGVAVPGLAVGHGELAALDEQVDVLGGAVGGQFGREQGELLEEGGALAPGARLAHRPAVPVVRHRRLVARRPAGEVHSVSNSSRTVAAVAPSFSTGACPCSAYPMAYFRTSSRDLVPWSRRSSSQASKAPGTAAASGPVPGTRSSPRPR